MPTFHTPEDDPVPAVTAAEMREVDRVATDEVGLGLLMMMENAGRNLAATVRERTDGPVVVLAGAGGNGGGGLCAARHLANHGRSVSVVLDRDPAELDGAARQQFAVLDAMDVSLREDPAAVDGAVAVDALVGYSLSGALRGRAADLAAAAGDADRVVSLDVPTGVDATSGETPGVAVAPDVTLTLALPKTGLASVGGDLLLADVAIPTVVYERAGVEAARPFDGAYRVALRRS